MDKVSLVIRQKHHNQAVSSMPPSLCSLPLFDKQRNRITIWTGPGAARKAALPFRCILCSMEGAQEKHKSARWDFLGGES